MPYLVAADLPAASAGSRFRALLDWCIEHRWTTIAATVAGLFSMLAYWGFLFGMGRGGRSGGNPLAIIGFALLILSPIAAKAMQAAVSRRRETLADVSACQLTRYPPGLISALEKLRDLRLAADRDDIPSRYKDLERIRSALQ